ncbi:MAG TPA: DUF4405 domain-containing protein [Microcoleus sp.]|nr:DUF4405 domain-containing protein [Microcoleus sp.]
MARRRKIHLLTYVRATIALTLLVVWSLAAITGFILEFAPKGYGTGRLPLFLSLTRSQWGDVHFLVCVIALCVTVVHVLLDWQVLRGYLRYLLNSHQDPDLFEQRSHIRKEFFRIHNRPDEPTQK